MPPRLTTKIEFSPKAPGLKGGEAHCMSVRKLVLENPGSLRQTVEVTGYGASYETALLTLLSAVCDIAGTSTFAADTMAAVAEQVPLAYIQRAYQCAVGPTRALLGHALNGTLTQARQAAENLEGAL